MSGLHFMIVWKRLINGTGKLREFHFAKFVSNLLVWFGEMFISL